MLNYELKMQVIRRYGSQTEAAKDFGMRETRLSRLIRGHELPWQEEAEIFRNKLGLKIPAAKRLKAKTGTLGNCGGHATQPREGNAERSR